LSDTRRVCLCLHCTYYIRGIVEAERETTFGNTYQLKCSAINSDTYSTKHPTLDVSAMESTMQQRRDEILAKKAKLAELKRQRELRRAESASRQSMTGSPLGEVGYLSKCFDASD
jgi:hypothetical protein